MAEKRTKGEPADRSRDPLGKSFESYGTTIKAIMLIILAVILALPGGAVVGGANALAWRLAESTDGMPYTIVGWVLVVIGMCVIAFAVYQLGRSFEVRRKGVRFRNRFNVTELRWDEIDLISVHKTTHVDQTGRRTGRIDWDITITGLTDEIHLSPTFLKMVPSVYGLVELLKMHCRQEIQLPTDF
jgi:hypothetical protein